MRQALSSVARPPELLEAVLSQAGAPTRPDELGWSPGDFAVAVRHAREIRNRYTFLDLAADCGLDPAAQCVR